MASPFVNILRLAAGDLAAKALNLLAFVYLARVLGVTEYGVLEFGQAVLIYVLLAADGGLELWATREAARGAEVRGLAGRIVPLRLLLAAAAFLGLVLLLPVFPDYPGLSGLLVLFALTLFPQAVSLKWAFMGRERLTTVGFGLAAAQLVFTLAVFLLVKRPEDVVWVPIFRLLGDVVLAGYFGGLFLAHHGRFRLRFGLRQAPAILRPALVLGAAHSLALMKFNFDLLLIGFLLGAAEVGWYGAAYKPITVALALPTTYFLGLFPALSRCFVEGPEVFRTLVRRSLRLTAIVALPIGVGGAFLSEPIIGLLFGPAYLPAVVVAQVLSWSAVLVVLRGTFRQSLNASGHQRMDLACALTAVSLNVGLNLVLIPRHGIAGAAAAAVVSEAAWLALAAFFFNTRVARAGLLQPLAAPAIAASAMAGTLWLAQSTFWVVQACLGFVAYAAVLFVLYQGRRWFARTAADRNRGSDVRNDGLVQNEADLREPCLEA